ncbi:MAG: glucose 1-dehydrogenase [Candidatus Omnitrophica bacterium]|nr:glucose 1-dehydrogenase [Candidatus Omnitrophota bacterium]
MSGRVALVTGASRGLGAAMAVALAEAGCSLVLWARHAATLKTVGRHLESLGRPVLIQQVDVTAPAQVRRAVARALRRFGRLDVLINNAGIWEGDWLTTLSIEAWSRVMATDLTSVFVVSQAAVPSMIRRRYGKIINISSTSGILAHPHGAAYCAAKAGVMHLTRVMAVEWGPYGIRVNSIAPGTFRTGMTADVFADRAWVARRVRQIPLRRFGEPEDLAGLVVFLASSASDHITGQTIVIDGGASLGIT